MYIYVFTQINASLYIYIHMYIPTYTKNVVFLCPRGLATFYEPVRCHLGHPGASAPPAQSGSWIGAAPRRRPTAPPGRGLGRLGPGFILYFILYQTILYHTIPYYTIPYYTILYYTILYYTILYHTLYSTKPYCTILYYTILYILPNHTIPYYTIPYFRFYPNHTILYHTILYHTLYFTQTILYHTILYHTILYHTRICHVGILVGSRVCWRNTGLRPAQDAKFGRGISA